jgi:hypothetical protein
MPTSSQFGRRRRPMVSSIALMCSTLLTVQFIHHASHARRVSTLLVAAWVKLISRSCHCKAVKYTLEVCCPSYYGIIADAPVQYSSTVSSESATYCLYLRVQLCQCSICRKVGGYMGSINIMGNNDTLNIIRGKDKIKYVAHQTSRLTEQGLHRPSDF